MIDTNKIKKYTLEEYLKNTAKNTHPMEKVEPVVYIYYAREKIIAQQFVRVNNSPIFINKFEEDDLNSLFNQLQYTGNADLKNLDAVLRAEGRLKINSIYLVSGNNMCKMVVETLLKGKKSFCIFGDDYDLDHFLSHADKKIGEYIVTQYNPITPYPEIVR